MPSKIAYVVKNQEGERVHIGSTVTASGDRCARLSRFGRPVTTFLISRSQLAKLKKGQSIHVHSASISLAETYGCTIHDGGLRGPRRRRRRRR